MLKTFSDISDGSHMIIPLSLNLMGLDFFCSLEIEQIFKHILVSKIIINMRPSEKTYHRLTKPKHNCF